MSLLTTSPHPQPSCPCYHKAALIKHMPRGVCSFRALQSRARLMIQRLHGEVVVTYSNKNPAVEAHKPPKGVSRWPNGKDITSSCPFYALPLSNTPTLAFQIAHCSLIQLWEARLLLKGQPAHRADPQLHWVYFLPDTSEVSSLQLSK